MAQKPKKGGNKKKTGWVSKDGVRVEPDKQGRWPAVSSLGGKTVVAGPSHGELPADLI